MQKSFAFLLIGLFFGTGAGFVVAAANNVALDAHDHGNPAQHGAGTGHDAHPASGHDHHLLRDVSGEGPLPAVAAELFADAAGGWNLHLTTENFAFAPQSVNGPHRAGEGHAHVYADGRKLARIYGPWVHFDDLKPGATLRVTLNANTHEELADGDHPIAVTLPVPARPAS